jgi:hypothetical protein
MIRHLIKKHSERGNSLDYQWNWAEIRIPQLRLEHIVQFVYIFGACGNIGPIQVEKEENVLVMEACTILSLERHSLDQRRYSRLHQMF